MVGSGIPLDETFLQHRLLHIAKEEMKRPEGGKLPVDDCLWVMGTADPIRTLSCDEVCVILVTLKNTCAQYMSEDLKSSIGHCFLSHLVEYMGRSALCNDMETNNVRE